MARRRRTPASLAEAQLAYERQFTDAQKLEFAFRQVLRLRDQFDEQLQADVYIARALDSLQRDIRSVGAEFRPGGPDSPGLADLLLGQIERVAAILARSEQLCARLELLAQAVEDRLLSSDLYTAQASTGLRTLTEEVRNLRRDLLPREQAVGAAD